eukprot:gnl/TRDRNA2_/TRDRNA2_172524_c2_seq2.p1 gnl/TRDRNA2_/TRDRNA2_172524_c2~~gnl/TRDRNA2_/TRDRNA2_172524_c2_seq2.p1  ORF type:complete len:501 (+),score=95.50 gnl/TRDRNA2_/TRDRNA2_172524_c2_seq2:36-1505(+)
MEDLELFCVRSGSVSTPLADIEEEAYGLLHTEAPPEVVNSRAANGSLSFLGCINSSFLTVSYIDEVMHRHIRAHLVPRVVPFLDFHPRVPPEKAVRSPTLPEKPETVKVQELKCFSASDEALPNDAASPKEGTLKPKKSLGISLGSWRAESVTGDLRCQRDLHQAASRIKTIGRQGGLAIPTRIELGESQAPAEDHAEAYRCLMEMDSYGHTAHVREVMRNVERGPLRLPHSVNNLDVQAIEKSGSLLNCSLVVPINENALVLETLLLDYFQYTDRAVALEVRRSEEYASVQEAVGLHSPLTAKAAITALHSHWVLASGGRLNTSDPDACVEVSPLLSYEGENLELSNKDQFKPPCHISSPDEAATVGKVSEGAEEADAPVADETADGLDTRLYYLQEYPQRKEMQHSQETKLSRMNGEGLITGRGAPSEDGTASLSGSAVGGAPVRQQQQQQETASDMPSGGVPMLNVPVRMNMGPKVFGHTMRAPAG